MQESTCKVAEIVLSRNRQLILPLSSRQVLFKFDSDGDCEEVLASRLGQVKAISFVGWGTKEFRQMAILSGCDYLPSIVGMGLKKAHALLRRCKTIEKLIQIVRFDGTMKVPKDYALEFRRAELTFEHQRVFDPRGDDGGRMSTLTPLPEGISDDDVPFIGAPIDDEIGRGIARGEIDPISREPMKDIAPKFQPQGGVVNNFKPKPKDSSNSSKSFYAPPKNKGKGSSVPRKQIEGQSSLLKFLRPKAESPSSASKSLTSSTSRSPLKNLNFSSSPLKLTDSQDAALTLEEESLQVSRIPPKMEATSSRFFQAKAALQKPEEIEEAQQHQQEEELEECQQEEDPEESEKPAQSSLAARFTFNNAAPKRKRSDDGTTPLMSSKLPSLLESDFKSASDPSSDQLIEEVEDDSGFWQSRPIVDGWSCDDDNLENLTTGKGWTPPGESKFRKLENGERQGSAARRADGEEELLTEGVGKRNRRDSLGSQIFSDQMEGILAADSEEEQELEGVLSSPSCHSQQRSTFSPSRESRRNGYQSPGSPLQTLSNRREAKEESQFQFLNPLKRCESHPTKTPSHSNSFKSFRRLSFHLDRPSVKAEEARIEAAWREPGAQELEEEDHPPPSSDPIELDSSPERLSSSRQPRKGFFNSSLKRHETMLPENREEEMNEEDEARIASVSRGLRERFSFKTPGNFEKSASSSSVSRGNGPLVGGRGGRASTKSISTPQLQFQETSRLLNSKMRSTSDSSHQMEDQDQKDQPRNTTSKMKRSSSTGLKRVGADHQNTSMTESPSLAVARSGRSRGIGEIGTTGEQSEKGKGLEQFRFVKR